MDGRGFLAIAGQLATGATEPHWRTAAGRSYYAIFLEAREALRRWGFAPPPREQAHRFVRMRFDFPAHSDLKRIGRALSDLSQLRNRADYDLGVGHWFTTANQCHAAVTHATTAIALLDQIDASSARRATAIAAIQAAFP